MSVLPWVLIFLAFPVTPLVVNRLRHAPERTEGGEGTQHLAVIGTMVQLALLGTGLALLVPKWL